MKEMRFSLGLVVAAVCLALAVDHTAATQNVTSFVDPFIGSGGIGFGVGSENPGPQVPFAMIRPGPDTTDVGPPLPFYHCGGYYYPDNIIRVFSHTHMVGAGAPDLGQVAVMPSNLAPSPEVVADYGYRSSFSHDAETASPGYYSVVLADSGVSVELTAALRTAVHRYTFATASSRFVYFYASHTVVPKACRNASVVFNTTGTEVSGWNWNFGDLSGRDGGDQVFFSITSDTPFAAWGTWEGNEVFPGNDAIVGTDVGGWIELAPGTDPVELRVAISYISVEQARFNMEVDLHGAPRPARVFDMVHEVTNGLWEQNLGRITVSAPGLTTGNKTKFYTAMYHAMLAPTTFSEAGDWYKGFDKNVHRLIVGQGSYYSDMSIWDIVRSEVPLLSLLEPGLMQDVVQSLLQMYEQGGDIPRWPLASGYTGCMIGTHANFIIVDAFIKGMCGFNATEAYLGMVSQATEPQARIGRTDIAFYLEHGYVPTDSGSSSVSRTLAYAWDDFAVATLGKALNLTDGEPFLNRSKSNYKNLWSAKHQLFCGKSAAGEVDCPDDVFVWGDLYTEGNALQWRWFVPQDPAGLLELMGEDDFVLKLDELLALSGLDPTNVLPNPYYWAGNEPDILAPWMFNFAGRPDLTQKWTRWVAATKYTTEPSGIPGNDDYGTISAWLFWSYLGLYPWTGTAYYLLGSPFFETATLALPDGITLTITAHNYGPENIYVSKAAVNGVALDCPFVDHNLLLSWADASLEFWMQGDPSPWGSSCRAPPDVGVVKCATPAE